jgi:asparagine synthase (glutamine-hydrolysing)
MEMGVYMRNMLLRDSDWAGMAHSVEIRTPFVDVELFRALAPYIASDTPPRKAHLYELGAQAYRSSYASDPRRVSRCR